MNNNNSTINNFDNRATITDKLFEKLQEADDISLFAESNTDSFTSITLKDYIQKLLRCHGLKKSQVISESGLNEIYIYQIMAGKRNPSRDKLLALAIAMKLDIEECQKLLKFGGVNELYPRNRRDAIILFGLKKKLNIFDLNELLFDLDEVIL